MQSGQTIAAIKLYRDRTGAGLKESKDAVVSRGAAQTDAAQAAAPEGDADAGVDDLIAQGRLIEAIKRHRELHGTGLKESKDAVEARRAQLGLG